ncbi:PEP/pyruvate-binding domain-containing protein [Cohnella suwonensis]|uniref:Phosphoenolpyruvate synthase n=1 Tax=Cohnella suwonensis TaxID=696072 RepID=A0ABW0LTH9_9BACL
MIPFSGAQADDAIGGKAQNLALLFQSRFPVPKGFIIAAHAFERVLQSNQDPDSWVFPETLRNEIMAAYQTFVTPPVVVRSSCSAEDMESASFAGQYESILHVTSDNLLESIKRCRLSVNKDHARFYLTHRFLAGGRAPAMSVIVQEFVDADVSGVIFSKNPITGNDDEIVINSSFGLGEAVVSGLVTPDLFILPKQGAAAQRKELGDKEHKTLLGPNGTRLVDTTAEEKSSFSLQNEQLHELKNATLAIEKLFGHPIDLEFAYRQGKLYILQARPIST